MPHCCISVHSCMYSTAVHCTCTAATGGGPSLAQRLEGVRAPLSRASAPPPLDPPSTASDIGSSSTSRRPPVFCFATRPALFLGERCPYYGPQVLCSTTVGYKLELFAALPHMTSTTSRCATSRAHSLLCRPAAPPALRRPEEGERYTELEDDEDDGALLAPIVAYGAERPSLLFPYCSCMC